MERKSILLKIGRNIRTSRRKAGLSQEELAQLCGLHRTYIGSVERGERNLSAISLVRIGKALGVIPSELMEGIE